MLSIPFISNMQAREVFSVRKDLEPNTILISKLIGFGPLICTWILVTIIICVILSGKLTFDGIMSCIEEGGILGVIELISGAVASFEGLRYVTIYRERCMRNSATSTCSLCV
ncbi:MAG: hypothetical protein JSW62_05715 [Thermoplasmatales archaeon]|nr:MAG: hypothetical protein JSW62_05715 [Thermoplasmatales archaeon]